jgi:hypothetical protein
MSFSTEQMIWQQGAGAKFSFRPGAAWRHVNSDAASFSSFGPNLTMLSELQSESTSRPASCQVQKTTAEMVVALSSVSNYNHNKTPEPTKRQIDYR